MIDHILIVGSITESLPGLNRIRGKVAESLHPQGIAQDILDSMETARQQTGSYKVGYLVGQIASTNPLELARNVRDMKKYSRAISKAHEIPVFSAADFSVTTARQAIHRVDPRNDLTDSLRLQRAIISGADVLYVAPGGEESRRVRDDLVTARRKGIPIFHIAERQKAVA